MALLDVDGLTAFYNDFQALYGVSLQVDAGQLVAIIGANGAGKSTLLKAISGLVASKKQMIRFDGEAVGAMRPSQLVRRGIAMVPEGRRLFSSLTVLENLQIGGQLKRPGPWNIARIFELFPILAERQNQPSHLLSGGQQQMVAIGRALMGRPQALLLDEPSLGLAPLVVKQMFEVIQRINKAGTTVLLAEQNAYAALKIADRAYVIEGGRIVLEGDRDALLGNETVRKAYIGA